MPDPNNLTQGSGMAGTNDQVYPWDATLYSENRVLTYKVVIQ